MIKINLVKCQLPVTNGTELECVYYIEQTVLTLRKEAIMDWERTWVRQKEDLYILIRARFEPCMDGMTKPYSEVCGYIQRVENENIFSYQWRVMVPLPTGNVKEADPEIRFLDPMSAMKHLEIANEMCA